MNSCTAGCKLGRRLRPHTGSHGRAVLGAPVGRPDASGDGSDCRGSRCLETDESQEDLRNTKGKTRQDASDEGPDRSRLHHQVFQNKKTVLFLHHKMSSLEIFFSSLL